MESFRLLCELDDRLGNDMAINKRPATPRSTERPPSQTLTRKEMQEVLDRERLEAAQEVYEMGFITEEHYKRIEKDLGMPKKELQPLYHVKSVNSYYLKTDTNRFTSVNPSAHRNIRPLIEVKNFRDLPSDVEEIIVDGKKIKTRHLSLPGVDKRIAPPAPPAKDDPSFKQVHYTDTAGSYTVTQVTTDEVHEFEVINRMSAAYRANKQEIDRELMNDTTRG